MRPILSGGQECSIMWLPMGIYVGVEFVNPKTKSSQSKELLIEGNSLLNNMRKLLGN
jgi:hypothetical protein